MATARLWISILFGICLLVVGSAAQAVVMTGLYEASVSVPDQSAAARETALSQALAAVLVKVTGDRNAPAQPALAKVVQNPESYLQQYRYQQSSTGGNANAAPTVMYDLTRTGTPAIPFTGLMLWAKFDPDVLDRAVRTAKEPLWGQERPVTLVWLALQDNSGKSIVSASNNPAVTQAMINAANQRGIELIFPRMDAQDQSAIEFSDIANDNSSRIQLASQIYKPDAILVGSVYMTTPGQYAARWQLTSGHESQTWNTPPDTLANVSADGIQSTADNFAQWYAVAAGAAGESGVSVSVTGIDTIDAYAKVLAYLSGLTVVKSVSVSRVKDGTVDFNLDTRGTLDNLKQAAVLGGLLKTVTAAPASASSVPPASAAALQFQYVP